jgi:hypothetical protein
MLVFTYFASASCGGIEEYLLISRHRLSNFVIMMGHFWKWLEVFLGRPLAGQFSLFENASFCSSGLFEYLEYLISDFWWARSN